MESIKKLNKSEIKALDYIMNIGLPRVYIQQPSPLPFVGGMYFLIITDAAGTPVEFYECRGYHRRKLIKVVDGEYMLINPLSPYMEGVFQSRQDVSNKFESHPLINGVYKRVLLDADYTN